MTRRIGDWGGNILSVVVVIVVNGLADAVPLGGQTTREISAKYPSLFTPESYVFLIWGLIYIGLLVFAVWQALPAQRTNRSLAEIRIPFQASCAFNAIWIFAWHYDLLILSLVFMVSILAALVQVYLSLDIGRSTPVLKERVVVHMLFSVYAGWITVATIANLSALQIHYGWDDFWVDAQIWTILKIALAGAVATIVLFRRQDIAFALVPVWAAAGIAYKHGGAVPAVSGAATAVVALGLLLIGFQLSEAVAVRRPAATRAPPHT